MKSRLVRAGLLLSLLVLVLPLTAGAGSAPGQRTDSAQRILFATDSAGNLLHFRAAAPEAARSQAITGLPAGVVLKGIDFRPATGDLYAEATRSSTA